MRTLTMCLALVSLIGVARADDTLHFATEGFSIKSLHPTVGAGPVQILSMQLGADGGFAPNVNVQLQPYAGTIDDYVKLSLDQFKPLGFTVIVKKKTSEESFVFEYSGTLQGMELHFYARAIRKKGKGIVYLVTGTTLMTQWAKSGPEIKGCVDSLKLD